jgi:hypothetical protein
MEGDNSQGGFLADMTTKTWISIAISVVIAYYISGYVTKKTNYQYLIAALGIPVGYLLNKKVYPKIKGSDSDSGSSGE